jgi:anaerobic magnesium-protoporphyrin IX monomethyl ester cyclase
MSSPEVEVPDTRRPVEVCLLRPPSLPVLDVATIDAVMPIGLAYLAGALKVSGERVHVIDAVGEAVNQYSAIPGYDRTLLHGLTTPEILDRIPEETEILGITCMFSVEWPFIAVLVQEIRERFPQVLIILGGEHVTALPEYSLTECPGIDVAVLGEGEETLVDLVDAYRTGRDLDTVRGIVFRRGDEFVNTAARPRIRALDAIPEPDWSLFPVEEYMGNGVTFGPDLGRCMPVIASRGCPYQCTFCSSPQMWTTFWGVRQPEQVLAEIKRYIEQYGAKNFDFYDLTMIIRKDWIKEFCRLLIAEGLSITWQLPSGTRSEAIDEEISKMLYVSGCRTICYAPESGSVAELSRIKKKVKPESMLASMRVAAANGISIKANVLFGLPGQTWLDVRETFRFIYRMARIGVESIGAYAFSPYPGTELFRNLVASGRIKVGPEYFRELLSYARFHRSVSFNDNMSNRVLSLVNTAANAYFYLLKIVLQPARSAKDLAGLLQKKGSTKLALAMRNVRRRQSAAALMRKLGKRTVVIKREA